VPGETAICRFHNSISITHKILRLHYKYQTISDLWGTTISLNSALFSKTLSGQSAHRWPYSRQPFGHVLLCSPKIFLPSQVLISVGGWVKSQVLVRLQVLQTLIHFIGYGTRILPSPGVLLKALCYRLPPLTYNARHKPI
jgi:hypothetical protein